MADRKISQLSAAIAGNLHDDALVAVVDLLEAALADQNVKATILQLRTAILAADSVTTAAIADSQVTTAKIADLNVTDGKLAASGLDAAKLTVGTLPIARIADGAVTPAKTSFISDLSASGKVFVGTATANLAASRLPTDWLVARKAGEAAGVYTVTHGLGTQDLIVLCSGGTPLGGGTTFRVVPIATGITTTKFDIYNWDTANSIYADSGFSFIAVRY